jgi:hypothetical protein
MPFLTEITNVSTVTHVDILNQRIHLDGGVNVQQNLLESARKGREEGS